MLDEVKNSFATLGLIGLLLWAIRIAISLRDLQIYKAAVSLGRVMRIDPRTMFRGFRHIRGSQEEISRIVSTNHLANYRTNVIQKLKVGSYVPEGGIEVSENGIEISVISQAKSLLVEVFVGVLTSDLNQAIRGEGDVKEGEEEKSKIDGVQEGFSVRDILTSPKRLFEGRRLLRDQDEHVEMSFKGKNDFVHALGKGCLRRIEVEINPFESGTNSVHIDVTLQDYLDWSRESRDRIMICVLIRANSNIVEQKSNLNDEAGNVKLDQYNASELLAISCDTPLSSQSPEELNRFYKSVSISQHCILDDQGNLWNVNEIFGLQTKTGENSGSQRRQSVDTSEECSICLTELRNIVILPCRHFSVCNQCLEKIDKCPVCRSRIVSVLKSRHSNTTDEDANTNMNARVSLV